MMDEASLEKALTKMEREVLALKTNHQIGLGTIKFYEKTLAVEAKTSISLTVKIANGEPLPPFLVVALTNGICYTPIVDTSTGIATVNAYLSSGFPAGNIVAVSSSLIESMAIS